MTQPIDPVTVGEISRQLERMEGSIGREIRDVKEMMATFVPREVFDAKLAELSADLDDLDAEVKSQAVTKRQVLITVLVIIIGEIVALFIALSNLAARTGGVIQ